MQRDSIPNTIVVALSLCLVCSLMVSLAAVGLKPKQELNATLDRKKNILEVTGFTSSDIRQAGGVEKLFETRFDTLVVNLETGEEDLEGLKEAMTEADKEFGEDLVTKYDQFAVAKSRDEDLADPIPPQKDVASVKFREKFSRVFILNDEAGNPEKYIFPVRGYGLWSMMQGYLALQPDLQTVAGLTFYEQKETPGLGGEVSNPNWKSLWKGKQVYDSESGAVKLEVVKGRGEGDYQVDGLSGATITSNGVTSMIDYWMGPEGFGSYIESQKEKMNSSGQSAASPNVGGDQHG